MATQNNYLFGMGERLVDPIPAPRRKVDKKHPYKFAEAKEWVRARVVETVNELDKLPQLACPDDRTVACLTLHPSYLAKSYYPSDLFETAGFETVGSKQTVVEPRKPKSTKKPSGKDATTTFFVSAKRNTFRDLPEMIDEIHEGSKEAGDIQKIETVSAQENKVQKLVSDKDYPLLEVVLHAAVRSDFILDGFREYLSDLDLKIDLDKRLQAGGLCFLPLSAPRNLIDDIAKYSFLRRVREMPTLRTLRPLIKSMATVFGFDVELPKTTPLDVNLKVAIFDGGLPSKPNLSAWVKYKEPFDIKASVPELQEHGLMVTSALLFGSIDQNRPLTIPYAHVDHYRVLDEDSLQDPTHEYHDVIRRIADVLQSEKYDFVNLSIGPKFPIEDDDVHAWTSILDGLLARGETLPSIAIGNDGKEDWESGMARIQPPGDCVNALSIGAADSQGGDWERADYSCIGPGRIFKPDALSFGGSQAEPFYVLKPDADASAMPIVGTSFASPNALRTAIGVRAVLGNVLTPLAVKALTIHRCEYGKQEARQVGHGRILSNIDDLITSPDDTAHVIYKGFLKPAEWIRAKIPVPAKNLDGEIEIAATICYTTEVDPHFPTNYARSGLRIVFRPNVDDLQELSEKDIAEGRVAAPKSDKFFVNDLARITQAELRDDAHLWETTRSHKQRFIKASRIKDPTFDIHYNARAFGAPTDNAREIPYALVITVRQRGVNTLYNSIVRRYRSQLEILRPSIRIPVRS